MSRLPRTGLARLMPAPHTIVAIAIGGILFAIAIGRGATDPDYFWHVKVGELIVETGRVPSVDPFSFTWHGQPWTPHEWLSEVVIFLLVRALGEAGALAVFALLPLATLIVVANTLATLGVRTAAQTPVLALVGLLTASFITLRPQAVSWLLLAVLLRLLVSVSRDQPRRLLWIGPLMLLWANLHGLYVIGVGVVTAYAFFSLIGRTPLTPRRGWAVAAMALALVGPMATPAGPIGILYPLRYRQAWGLENIQEWQSPNFHDPAHWPLLLLLLGLFLAGGRASPGWMRTVAYAGPLLALTALRNTPVAAILAAPVIALGLESWVAAMRGPHRLAPRSAAAARRVMELGVAAAIVGGALVVFGSRPADPPQDYPSAAVSRLSSVDPPPRVVAEYGWGGYVIHELFDGGGRVFVDGRNDMYAEEILDGYTTIAVGDPGWEDIADRYAADTLLFPPSRPITKGIAQAAGWCEAYRDTTQVLLRRDC